MQFFINQLQNIRPQFREFIEQRKEYKIGKEKVTKSLQTQGRDEYYLVSKEWMRQWKNYVGYTDDEDDMPERVKPPRINDELIRQDDQIDVYSPDFKEYNQTIKPLDEDWEYELMCENTFKYFQGKYGGVEIKRVGIFIPENNKKVVSPNLQKQFAIIKTQQQKFLLLKLQIDRHFLLKHWILMIKGKIEYEYKLKIKEIRIWQTRHKTLHRDIVFGQLTQNSKFVDGSIIEKEGQIYSENSFMRQFENQVLIVDYKLENGDWQFAQLDEQKAFKIDQSLLFSRMKSGCNRYCCDFNYCHCHKDSIFSSTELSEDDLQGICSQILDDPDDRMNLASMCNELNKAEPKPYYAAEYSNDRQGCGQRLKILTQYLDVFGASFVENQTNPTNGCYNVDVQDHRIDNRFIDVLVQHIEQQSPTKIPERSNVELQRQKEVKQMQQQGGQMQQERQQYDLSNSFNKFSYINQWVESLFKEDLAINNLYRLRAIFILLQFKQCFYELVNNFKFLKIVAKISQQFKNILISWLANNNPEKLQALANQIKFSIGRIIETEQNKDQNKLLPLIQLDVINRLRFLFELYTILFQANKLCGAVKNEHFVIEGISTIYKEKTPEYYEYGQFDCYKRSRWDDYYFTFCNYPFAISLSYKTKLLEIESRIRQHKDLRQYLYRLDFQGGLPYLEVDRRDIIGTTFSQLGRFQHQLKLPLKVRFVGEECHDEGGPKREFFRLLVQELFKLEYGMFILKCNNTITWFNSRSFEMPITFNQIGKLLGLALYNQVLLDLRFPTLVFKKLMNEPVGLEDLKELDFELYQGLIKLREYKQPDLENAFMLTFSVVYTIWGEQYQDDLVENGFNLLVNQENKEQYISLYVDWYLNKSIAQQFRLFQEGFMEVVDGMAIKIFSGEEVQKMIVGEATFDLTELEKVAQYEGYDEKGDYIKAFWEIVRGLDIDSQKRFLFFCTGSDRIPVGGFLKTKFKFLIQKHGENTEQLPSAHTCFNTLLLPMYSTKEKLRQKLLISLSHNEGFGLL